MCSHISDPSALSKQVVYGCMENFQFSNLIEKVQGKPASLQNTHLILDEADTVLDEAFNDTRLSAPYQDSFRHQKLLPCVFKFYQEYLYGSKTGQHLSEHLRMHIGIDIPATEADELLSQVHYAHCLQRDKDYILQRNKVIIVDKKHTGMLRHGMRWDKLVHAFVELKEGLQPEGEQKIIASDNRINFVNQYSTIHGMTGTLGNASDRKALETLLGTFLYDSPRCHEKKTQLLPDVLTANAKQHTQAILETAITLASRTSNRPVLVMVETIEEVRQLYAQLNKIRPRQIQYYDGQGNFPEDTLACAGKPGYITIATKIAGRGADIKPTSLAELNGGLAVIITEAMHERTREQADGRTGRKGRKGTSQHILNSEALSRQFPHLTDLREWRTAADANDPERLNRLKVHLQKAMILKCALDLIAKLPPNMIKTITKNEWPLHYTNWNEASQQSTLTPAGLMRQISFDFYHFLSRHNIDPKPVFNGKPHFGHYCLERLGESPFSSAEISLLTREITDTPDYSATVAGAGAGAGAGAMAGAGAGAGARAMAGAGAGAGAGAMAGAGAGAGAGAMAGAGAGAGAAAAAGAGAGAMAGAGAGAGMPVNNTDLVAESIKYAFTFGDIDEFLAKYLAEQEPPPP